MNRKSSSVRKAAGLSAMVLAAVMAFSAISFPGRKYSDVRAAEQYGMIDGNVIYSENFDNVENGSLPEGWTISDTLKAGGSAAVEDGKLVIRAMSVNLGKVLLPASLSEYGNYTVEADVSFKSSTDANRWMSIVVRQQAADEHYYHMCVRRTTTASNGVEFAIRTPGEWNVVTTAAADTSLGLDNEVHIKMSIADGAVYEYVDGEEVLTTNALSGMRGIHEKGGIGFQANFSIVTIDNVVVSECEYVEDPAASANDMYMSHNFLITPVISAAATIAVADSSDTVSRLAELNQKPDNIIIYVDDDGNAAKPDGSGTLGPLSETVDTIYRKMIPVFYVKTEAAAEALIAYLKEAKLQDCMVASDDTAVVAKARKARKRAGGVVDFRGRDLSVKDGGTVYDILDDIIYTTNMSSAKTAIIPESLASKENVEYMQHRLITVWVAEESGPEEAAMLHNAIQSGANGIITDTPELLIASYSLYKNDPAVLVRNPMVIGHRGLPSSAPENSIESAKEAVKAGVDCIELDVRLSKDGKIYIYHDNGLESLTTGSGTVNSHTAAELDTYKIVKSSSYGTFEKYPQVKLPSLEEFFEALKDDDVMFFIEIKEDGEISAKVAELVEKFGLKNRCCMITFLNSQVTRFQKDEPGMSTGQLMSTPAGTGYEEKIKSIIGTIGGENATFNASGVYDTRMIRALMYRGITAWPWTYNKGNTRQAYLLGVGGITTDYCNTVSTVPTEIDIGTEYDITLYTNVKSRGSVTFKPKVYNRIGEADLTAKYEDGTPVNIPEPVIIEGAEHVKVEGNKITALSDGTVRLMYRLVCSTDPDNAPVEFSDTAFALYTQVVTVNIVTAEDPDSVVIPEPEDKNVRKTDSAAIITVCAVCAGVIGICCVLLAVLGKKKNKKDHK